MASSILGILGYRLKLLIKLASPTGESSNQKDLNRQLEPPGEGTVDRLFETFQAWNVALNRLKTRSSPV